MLYSTVKRLSTRWCRPVSSPAPLCARPLMATGWTAPGSSKGK